jgi:hypothetical protein
VNTEADTCRKFVVPRLQTADWGGASHAINERRTCTDGRVIFLGGKAKRGRQKRADYILRYRADYPIAVVEAKAAYKSAADGLQQAKDYAEILGPKFAYSSERWLTRRPIAGAEVGTIVSLDIAGMGLDWSKSYKGVDHGALFLGYLGPAYALQIPCWGLYRAIKEMELWIRF